MPAEVKAHRKAARAPILRVLGPPSNNGTLRLAFKALDTGDVHRPGQRRATPALLCRAQFGAAVERSHPQAIRRWVGARSRRIERCTAIGAEPVRPLVPA